MNREEKILRHIDKNGMGIEIGSSYNPIASKNKGYKVHVIDHLNREQLIEKYKPHNVNLDNIEEVDFVWKGENYSELTGKTKHYDWIIASHVIEHTPDLIDFLKNCDSVLKDDGIISLAVPDKRYCFDHHRPITGISRIIDSHLGKNKIHTPGTVAEYYLNMVNNSGNITWQVNTPEEYDFMIPFEDAQKKMMSVINRNAYVDVHAWCFVPHSFRLIINDLFNLGLIPFQELDFFPTAGCEFHITLSRKGKGIDKSRLEILNIIEAETKDSTTISTPDLDSISLKKLIKYTFCRTIKKYTTNFVHPFKSTAKSLF